MPQNQRNGNSATGSYTPPVPKPQPAAERTAQQHGSDNASPPYNKIAVIGMSGRFAKADNLAELWERLQAGQNSLTEVPEKRFDCKQLQREPKGPFFGNFLEDPDRFDHKFFGFSSREAKAMDPQQRILLEVAYDTLSSAGYFCRSEAAPEKNIGCYVGVGSVDYDANTASHDASAFSATGTLRAFVSGKVSHYFGWTGPSITCDTACSSSAVAIHSACMALQMGECSEALAGGVNVITNPALYQNLAAASFLSPTGASKAFDAAADGYCRGEGAGLILLKPYERAIADGDEVIGIISGSAVNQGSNCSPITVPDSSSQRDLYQTALERGNVSATDVTYVECHGTGTPVGDPIEYESVQKTFSSPNRTDDIFIGSIKDSIGHCEGASGIAGVLKVLMMMQHRKIPKQANFKSINPRIKTSADDRIEVPTSTQEWKADGLKALVNNYGAAGSNAAILLEQAPLPSTENAASESIELPFVITGKTADAVTKFCKALHSRLTSLSSASVEIDLRSLSGSICRRQNPLHEFSWSCTASSLSDLLEALQGAAQKPATKKSKCSPKPVILCFPGQNGQTVSLDEPFVKSTPLFEKYLVDCDTIFRSLNFPRLFPRIFDTSPYDDIVQLHCALFAVQYSSAMSWISSGVHVDRLIGHSFGQLTAMCVSGCMSLEDSIKLVATRARLLVKCLGDSYGTMISVEGEPSDLDQLVTSLARNKDLDMACHNSPRHVVLAGTEKAVSEFESSSSSSRFKLAPLKNSHAYHSHLIEPIESELFRAAKTINFSDMKIPIETCTENSSWSYFNASRVVQHSRDTVYFSEATQRIINEFGDCVWLDVGTASPMSVMIQRVVSATDTTDQVTLSADLGSTNKSKTLAKMVCSLWDNSVAAKHWSWYGQQPTLLTDLPLYPFETTPAWLDFIIPTSGPTVQTSLPAQQDQPKGLLVLTQKATGSSPRTSLLLNVHNETFKTCTEGHAVLEQSLCPASMYIEMLAEAVGHVAPDGLQMLQVSDLKITRPLGLVPDAPTYVHITKTSGSSLTWDFDLTSDANGKSKAASHATGRITAQTKAEKPTVDRELSTLRRLVSWDRVNSILSSPDSDSMNGRFVYKSFGEVVDYKPYYQGVSKFAATENEAVGRISLPSSPLQDSRKNLTSPIALDTFLQVAGVHINCWKSRNKSEVFMCTETQDIYLDQQHLENGGNETEWLVYACLDEVSAKEVHYDIFILSAQTKKISAVLKGVRFFSVNMKAMRQTLSKGNGPAAALKSPQLQPIDTKQEAPAPAPAKEEAEAEEDESEEEEEEADGEPAGDMFGDVRNMLSQVMDIEEDEVGRETDLTELGVDSLMITEVLREVQKRFSVSISMEDFQSLNSTQDLCNKISPSAPAAPKPKKTKKKSQKSAPSPDSDFVKVSSDDSSGTLTPLSDFERDQVVNKAQESFYRVNEHIDEIMDETRFSNFYEQVYPSQAELVTRYVVEAFALLKCPLAKMKAGDELPSVSHQPQHTKVVKQLYNILADAGLATLDESTGKYQRTSKQAPSEAADGLQKHLVDSFPQHVSEHKLLKITAAHLADCLTGKKNPTSLIFGDATSRAILSDLYAEAPMFKAGTILLEKYLSDLFGAVDPEQELHILELGAGTGGTTSLLLEGLAKIGRKFTYTFTDLSSSLVVAAKKKFKAYPFMRYQTMDIEKEPPMEVLSKYDVVISTNCIHATKNLVNSTSNIRKMLKPDGILCLVELTRNLFWFDLVFGLLEGWWLFNDGRQHVLASAQRWNEELKRAGYNWVAWSQGASEESNVLRVITASPSAGDKSLVKSIEPVAPKQLAKNDTFRYKDSGGIELFADVHYPGTSQAGKKPLPVVLMIHGGGHVLLSRKSFGAEQFRVLLDAGFVVVSVDYRLCPESTLPNGAMADVRDALEWIRTDLPHESLSRPDIKLDPSRVVAAGWSTGGHLAMTLAWTTVNAGYQPPDAILALYCPTDYEDKFWRMPNIPRGSEEAARTLKYNLVQGTFPQEVASYEIPRDQPFEDGWMAVGDKRSRIPLHMNWHGNALQVILRGMEAINAQSQGEDMSEIPLGRDEIQYISPLAQIELGNYKTPTYIIHGTEDDLIPYQQSQRTQRALEAQGVDSRVDIVQDAPHLFDVFHARRNKSYRQVVEAGVEFLREYV